MLNKMFVNVQRMFSSNGTDIHFCYYIYYDIEKNEAVFNVPLPT